MIAFGATIGIIGAGQLGKMLAQSAQKMGYRVAMYDPNPESCGFAVANRYTCASFSDGPALLEFVQSVDVVTYEFENIDGALLADIAAQAHLPQGTALLQYSQNRLHEKEWLTQIGLPVVPYRAVHDEASLMAGITDLGYPCILKTARFGYDGKGQVRLTSPEDLDKALPLLTQDCVLEAWCPFAYEASVMVVGDQHGNIRTFPVSQNQHEAGVLFVGVAPAAVLTDVVTKRLETYAHTLAQAVHLVGLCGIECFVTADGDVYINEIAPRPHNSGHYTIESCSLSQYDAHILAIVGRPVPAITCFSPSVMINILGQHLPMLPELMALLPEASVHIYQKGEAKTQRKMGHLTWLLPEAPHIDTLLAEHDILSAWAQAFH